ncbi:MAG: indolepyruvate oxidoreductase [Bacteroidetes bacterium 4572_117]|nr:MAG: indolepyruvate oxidoreductase [Bacteroidetes bacterium 4572_117]
MKIDIILAGVGGQGILTIAATIGTAALQNNLFLKQSEVHGMSQRGGDVQANLRISDKPIASDLIAKGKADVIIAVEPMESLRYLPFLSKDGWLVTNSTPFVNINNYPDKDKLIKKVKAVKNNIVIDADTMAKEIKAARSSNIVMLGAASSFLDLKYEDLEAAIRTIFERKGEKIVETNLKALKIGKEAAEKQI